jgi:predicted dehydrogenase
MTSNPSEPQRTSGAGLSRRQFVKTSALALGSVSLASMPTVIPAAAFGANDCIRIGVIGCGGQGTGHVSSLVKRSTGDNIKVVAVSDVYQRRVTRAKDICKAEGYLDYRKLLEQKDVDAVLIATPDHWHGKISIDAMDAGKHVYCEKPMTHTVEQALQVRDAVKRYKKVFQVGPNATASDTYWKAREAIRQGRIGKATWVHGSYNRNARICLFNDNQKIDPTAGPDKTGEDYINWDMWLGYEWDLAPKIPWTPDHYFRFRKYWPYSGGVATDLLYHKLAPLLIAMVGANGEYPSRVNACGGLYIEKDGRDIPDTFLLTADYPSEWSIFLVSTLTNDADLPDRIFGKYGTMDLGGSVKMRFNGAFQEEFTKKNDDKLETSIASEPRRDLEGNWIDAMRGKGTVFCNEDLGCSTMVAIKMAVDSYRQRKTMLWDAANEKAYPA